MSSFMATLSLKWRVIEEYDNLTFQTEPSVTVPELSELDIDTKAPSLYRISGAR